MSFKIETLDKLTENSSLALEDLRELFDQSRATIRDHSVSLFTEDPLVGLEIGHLYKRLTYNAINYWYKYSCPADIKNNFAILTFGSTARGELCFYSDIDLLVAHSGEVPSEKFTEVIKNLDHFLKETGFKPEIKILDTNKTIPADFNQDLVNAEVITTTEAVVGREDLLSAFAQNAVEAIQKKALFSVIEQKNPRVHNPKHDGEEVFNLKWDEGSLNDFMILRSIARSYGSQSLETIDCLRDLFRLGKVDEAELLTLVRSFSEYQFFRNETHLFAGEAAERLGPKTRRFITETVPSLGNSDEFKKHTEELRKNVRRIFIHIRDQFLEANGISPDVYENFNQLTIEKQLDFATSSNSNFVMLAAWGTENSEVLSKALEIQPDYAVLQAVSRSKYSLPETLQQIEVLTRNNPNFGFSRLMLAVQYNANAELLVNLYKNTQPNSGREIKIREIAKRRLAHFHYDEEVELNDDLKRHVESIIFYPETAINYFLNSSSEALRICPGKLYINYAGRLATGKNFDAFLRLAAILEEKGVDFEAHIFGSMEPSFSKDLDVFWKLFGNNSNLIKRLKYHGEYDLTSLKNAAAEMQKLGTSMFLLSKGLTTKELLAMGQPVITSVKGNNDVSELGTAYLDEEQFQDPQYLEKVVENLLLVSNSRDELKLMGEEAHRFVSREYGLDKWGRQLKKELQILKPGCSQVLILGTSSLDSPHGPASWSRNLLSFATKDKDIKANYISLYASDPLVFSQQEIVEGDVEEQTRVYRELKKIIDVVISVDLKKQVPSDSTDEFINSLIKLSENSNAILILSSSNARDVAQEEFEKHDITQKQILYPLIACDEVTSYGKPVKPLFRLTHIMEMLQRELPQSDVNVAFGSSHPLVSVKEKITNGTPFAYVDHTLASEEPLIKAILENDYYSQEEKDWFVKLNKLIKATLVRYADKYIALWEINQNIAIKQLGFPSEKITLIPNGIDTEALKI